MTSVPAGSGDGRALIVSVTEQDDSLRVTVTGELDVSTVPAFNKELAELRHASARTRRARPERHHFHGLDRAVGRARRGDACPHEGSALRGRGAGPPHVHELFKLTGVDNFLEVVGPGDAPA